MKTEIEILTKAVNCPHCKSVKTIKQGTDGTSVYYMCCLDCKKEWDEKWKDKLTYKLK